MKRTVIIGSGITGMAAALLLAKQESHEEILLLEAANTLAPLLSGFTRKGLHFDTGFHCGGGLGQGGLLRHWLRYLDVWEHIGEENIYPMQEEFRFGYGAEVFHFPASSYDLSFSIAKQFGAEYAQNFVKLYKELTHVLTLSPYTNPQSHELPKLSWENSQNLAYKLEQYSLPAPLKQMLKARCLLYGLKPEDASFHDYALVGGLYFDSCHGIYGGGKMLVQALQKAMAQKDVTIRCKAKVSRILHHNKSVKALELTTGEIIPATRCIFTGHPSQLPHIVERGVFRPAFYQHIRAMEETASAFMVFAESEKNYASQRATYLLPEDMQASVLTPIGHIQPTAYVVGGHNHKEQKGKTSGFPLVAIFPIQGNAFGNIPKPRPQEYVQEKMRIATQMQSYLQERLPELGTLKVHDTATTATMQDWIYGSLGSLNGIAHTTTSMPLLPVTRMKGLFLAGQNILLPGILGGIVSAALAVGFATDHHIVLEGFRTCAKDVLS